MKWCWLYIVKFQSRHPKRPILKGSVDSLINNISLLARNLPSLCHAISGIFRAKVSSVNHWPSYDFRLRGPALSKKWGRRAFFVAHNDINDWRSWTYNQLILYQAKTSKDDTRKFFPVDCGVLRPHDRPMLLTRNRLRKVTWRDHLWDQSAIKFTRYATGSVGPLFRSDSKRSFVLTFCIRTPMRACFNLCRPTFCAT